MRIVAMGWRLIYSGEELGPISAEAGTSSTSAYLGAGSMQLRPTASKFGVLWSSSLTFRPLLWYGCTVGFDTLGFGFSMRAAVIVNKSLSLESQTQEELAL